MERPFPLSRCAVFTFLICVVFLSIFLCPDISIAQSNTITSIEGESTTSEEGTSSENTAAEKTITPAEADDDLINWDDTSSEQPSSPLGGKSLSELLINMVVALVIIVVIIIGISYVYKRFVPSVGKMFASNTIKILARTYISSKQSIVLVRIGSRIYVIGSSPAGLVNLGEITDADDVMKIQSMSESASPKSVTRSFKDMFKKESASYDGNAPSDGSSAELSDIKNELDAMLEKVRDWKEKEGAI